MTPASEAELNDLYDAALEFGENFRRPIPELRRPRQRARLETR